MTPGSAVTAVRVLAARLLALVTPGRRDAELDEEIGAHLDLLTDEHVRRGLSFDEARAAARRAFGGVDQVKAVYRDQRGLPFVDALTQDVRFAVRLLRRDRGFAATAALVLGLGIGVNNHALHDPERSLSSEGSWPCLPSNGWTTARIG